LHKLDHLPGSLDASSYLTVQMVHDHDLCCPRRHKYFAASNRICTQPAGWRCYLDGAFLEKNPSGLIGVSYSSIERKLQEMRRRQSLDGFIVASEFMRSELIQNGFSKQKIHVLPLGVRQQNPVTPIPISSVPTILFVGQLVKGKGVDLLLGALSKITVPFSAVIVGKGNAEESLRKLCAKLKLVGKVEFRGWMNHEQLASLYSGARLVAVSSRWPEPYGLVGIEAMRFARPVVAFDVGGIPDWLQNGRTGFLVPEQDVTAFSKALQLLLSDYDLARAMGIAGLSAATKFFSSDRYIDQLESILLPATVRGTSDRSLEVFA
jgi:glycosyltransferase involved in cell wall biosynthesis